MDKILNFLFPEKCLFCKRGEIVVCKNCFSNIPKNLRFKENILSLYEYKNPKINKLLWKLKYHHTNGVAKIFGDILREEIGLYLTQPLLTKERSSANIFLVPIPLNTNDKRIHNHAELVAKATGLKVIPDLLIKNSRQKQAHTKSKKERFENIKDSFTINLEVSTSPLFEGGARGGYKFIIIDDVTTTGATINEARKVLAEYLKINTKEIFAAVVAR